MHLRHRGTSGGKWEVVKMSGIANLSLKSGTGPATFFFTGSLLRKNSDLCVLCKYLWWISETPEIISRDDEWAWIIAEPLPGIPHGTENNTTPGPGAEKVRRNEAWYGRVFDAGGELLIRILCHIHIHLVHPSHIHIHLQQGGGRHLGWQQHLAINSLGW